MHLRGIIRPDADEDLHPGGGCQSGGGLVHAVAHDERNRVRDRPGGCGEVPRGGIQKRGHENGDLRGRQEQLELVVAFSIADGEVCVGDVASCVQCPSLHREGEQQDVVVRILDVHGRKRNGCIFVGDDGRFQWINRRSVVDGRHPDGHRKDVCAAAKVVSPDTDELGAEVVCSRQIRQGRKCDVEAAQISSQP
eukprot:scaffold825_cov249-Pinguiococcus_pyrenoidosus.AAC.26